MLLVTKGYGMPMVTVTRCGNDWGWYAGDTGDKVGNCVDPWYW